jgi:hypothetical protein
MKERKVKQVLCDEWYQWKCERYKERMGVNMMEICTYIWKLISLLSVYGFH